MGYSCREGSLCFCVCVSSHCDVCVLCYTHLQKSSNAGVGDVAWAATHICVATAIFCNCYVLQLLCVATAMCLQLRSVATSMFFNCYVSQLRYFATTMCCNCYVLQLLCVATAMCC